MSRYAEIAVFPHRVPITKRLPETYTYLVPADWPELQVGAFVLAPFGTASDLDRLVSGIVMRTTDETPAVSRLKPLTALLDARTVIAPAHLELAHWLAATYLEPLSNCVRLFAPPGQSIHSDIEYALNDRPEILPRFYQSQAELIEMLRQRGPLRAGQINAAFGQRDWKRPIGQLIDQGWVVKRRVLPAPGTHGKRIKLAALAVNPIDIAAIPLGKTAETQRRRRSLLAFLQQRAAASEIDWLLAETGSTSADLAWLEAKGLVEFHYREVLRDPLADKIFAPAVPPALTQDQAQAWQAIQPQLALSTSSLVYLLHGITGSGKTEIYLRAVTEVLQHGRQAIVLVPEIALTPQTIQRFAARCPDRIAVWHSELSLNERYDTWRRVQLGLVDLVIGARSALFLPFDQLGLIVLDEEHDNSYKQS
ncbi:MAG TPA: DEAD/DEAH box helicase, partial [Anaerolineae bacterium]|nr:DEAD/DEAH box helicase [Anaerolineae bacterium]